MSNKKYYWLKLKEDFFEEDTISWIEEQENGKEYCLFYLKLCLKSLKTNGTLIRNVGTMLVPYDVKQLGKITNTDIDTVRIAMELFKNIGLVEILDNGEIYLRQLQNMVGSETSKAQLMRNKRAKDKKELPQIDILKHEAKSNAFRQKAFRAKKFCEEKQHIPLIESHYNNKRYNGNYYIVLKRDKCKCSICGSIENLCVHHIDGYSEENPENSNENKMITLCRTCHAQVHAGAEIPEDILESINYYEDNSNVTENCYRVTENRYTEIEQEIDIETETDIEIEKEIEIEQQQEIEKIVVGKVSMYFPYLNEKDVNAIKNEFLKTNKDIYYLIEKLILTFDNKDIKNKIGYLLKAIRDDYKMNLVTKPDMLLQVWQQEMLEKPNNPIIADKVEYFRHLCEQ